MPLSNYTKTRKAAFTLAEVLITLGIIGIVAALTMPVLITKYQKKVAATRVKKVYSELSQAVKLSEVDNGPIKYWDYDLSGEPIKNSELVFEKYIEKYYKNISYCDYKTRPCGSSVGTAGVHYITVNGTAISISSNPSRNVVANILISLDTRPKKYLHNCFYFVIDKKYGVVPFGMMDNLTREDILNGYKFEQYNIGCNESDINACTALLMLDEWEFTDDYPW